MDKYLIIELLDNLNLVINQPLQNTQRIKYTCFDVSEHYIVFGATSGGLYMYNRYPCKFDKLIPSKEGPIIHICISPDERIIAVGTAKGIIHLVDNTNSNSSIPQFYTEHQGNNITAMHWDKSSNELYTGDDKGKVSVTLTSTFITKTMLKTPCATIMTLDSRIVQIDWCFNFLVVSTLTRCYLCHTEKEQYRQVGQKLRDGEFGACFYNLNEGFVPASWSEVQRTGEFTTLTDEEKFSSSDEMADLKIFCGRPGWRLWEVNIDGIVVSTHQFKHLLETAPNAVVHIDDSKDSCYIETTELKIPQNHNFIKLNVIGVKYIFTYTSDMIFIFAPENRAVVFCTTEYRNIIDAKIVKNFIYVWTNDGVHLLLFSTLENIILRCLFKKQYVVCAEICDRYAEDVKNLIPFSSNIHLLLILEDKLSERSDLCDKIAPLIASLKSSEEKQIAQKLQSGIYVIDNGHMLPASTSDVGMFRAPETLKTLKDISNTVSEKLNEGTKSLKEKWQNIEERVKYISIDPSEIKSNVPRLPKKLSDDESENAKDSDNEKEYTEDELFKILQNELEINKANKMINTNKLGRIFDNQKTLLAVSVLLRNFEDFILSLDPSEHKVQIWCYIWFLNYINFKKEKDAFEYVQNETDLDYLIKAFATINFKSIVCSCNYPIPHKPEVPDYFAIGCDIVEKFEMNESQYMELCSKVPYMWKSVFRVSQSEFGHLLPLVIQLADKETLDAFSSKFTYDLCDEAVRLFIKLKKGICLNCGTDISLEHCDLSWTSFCVLIMKSIGSLSAVELLLRYSEQIQPGQLDAEFYQKCIFTSLATNFKENTDNSHTKISDVVEKSTLSTVEFGRTLEKILEQKCMKANLRSPPPYTRIQLKDQICSFCSLSLQTPELEISPSNSPNCKHVFHAFCFSLQNNVCSICGPEENIS